MSSNFDLWKRREKSCQCCENKIKFWFAVHGMFKKKKFPAEDNKKVQLEALSY